MQKLKVLVCGTVLALVCLTCLGGDPNLVISARAAFPEFGRKDKVIVVTVLFRNTSNEVVEVEEGRLGAEFVDQALTGHFQQSVRASYKRGEYVVRLAPGEIYTEPLSLHLKDDVRPGAYRLRVRYYLKNTDPPEKWLRSEEVIFRIR